MKKIIYPLLGLLLFSACKKDFLETTPTETVANPPAQAKLNGLYTLMIEKYSGGIDAQYDYGQKGVDIMMDMLSGDMAIAATNYNYYTTISNLNATQDNSSLYVYMPWRFYYKMIKVCNSIIDPMGSPTIDADKHALGQAQAMRAYAYFMLTTLYTTHYEPDSKTNSIPLYITEQETANPKSPQKEIYAQMVTDLEAAIQNLEGYQRTKIGAINKTVAQGILAYVYAAMGENAKAAELSQKVMQSGTPITTEKDLVYKLRSGATVENGGGFNDATTPSWLWGFDITPDNKLNIGSWWGHMDIFTYGYPSAGDFKIIDQELYNKFRQGDVRKEQFSAGGEKLAGLGTLPLGVPYNKFFHPARIVDGQRELSTDYIFMRVDEFHLLAAETLAKSGNQTKAKEIYKNFLLTRFPNEKDATAEATRIDALTGQALLDDISVNTRLELWGEGKALFELKRNKRSATRGDNHKELQGQSFPYNDTHTSFRIPQIEEQNNVNLHK